MIPFRCPFCGKTLQAPEKKAGATAACPRCNERLAIPLTADGADAVLSASGAWGPSPARPHGDQAPPLLPAMTRGVRWAVGLAAGVGILSLLLAVTTAFLPAPAAAADAARGAAMILVPACAVAVLVVLYGAATACPSCRRWWARRLVEKEFVDRAVFEKDGSPIGRSTYRTTYECTSCRHRWSATAADEYKEAVRERPRRRMG
jgi:hypothetical protein